MKIVAEISQHSLNFTALTGTLVKVSTKFRESKSEQALINRIRY